MIVKRNFNALKVLRYVRTELLFSLSASALAVMVFRIFPHAVVLPFSIAAILGSALAIFIAFRNNSSYSRWWEARTLWGGIINSSRIFARLVITFTDSHENTANFDKQRNQTFKREMIYKIIAWSHALRLHLRKQEDWTILRPYLSEQEYTLVLRAQNKPNSLHLLTGQSIYKAMNNGTLAGFDSFQLEGQLAALANYQGGCERIKNTPLLRQYDYFTRLFLFTFIGILPFSLVSDFAKMDISFLVMPISVLLSFVFAIIGKVGEVNEDPFENKITDVPLTALCNTIERDLRDMLMEENLPEKSTSKDGFIF